MANIETLGNLAKTFVTAVNQAFNTKPDIGLQLLQAANEIQSFKLTSALMGTETTNTPGLQAEKTAKDHLDAADIIAEIAEKAGMSDELKTLIPGAAHNIEVSVAITEHAPNFGKLCL